MDFSLLSLIKPVPAGFAFRPSLTEQDVQGRIFALLASSRPATERCLAPFDSRGAGIVITRGPSSHWEECGPLLYHLVVPEADSWPTVEQLRPQLELLSRLYRSETESQANSETLRQIIDTIPHYVFWKGHDLTYLGCNERFARAAGLATAAEIVGKDDYQLAWRNTAERYRADDRKVIESGSELLNYIEPQSRPDGSTLWVETSKVPLYNNTGQIRGMLGIYQDVTARKQAEQRLEESERQLRVIFETSRAGIILVDAKGIITFANQSMAEMFGCDLEELIGSNYPEHVFPQEQQAGDTMMRRLIRGEIDHVYHERHYLRTDGSDFWGYLSGKRLETPDGQFQGLVGIINDISDWRRAEEAQARTLSFVETLLAQSPIAIRVFDGESGACLQANQAAAKIAGGSHEALLEQNFRELASWREAGLDRRAEEVLVSGKEQRVEVQLHTSFGKQELVAYSLSRFIVEERAHLLVLGQDITEQKRLDEENRRIAEQFLHAQKLESLGILAGGIAHDFNNILLAITGNVDLALRRINRNASPVGHLERIKQATENAANLSRQMLAYSGKGKFLVESLDLNALLEEMLHMLEVSISKKVTLRLNLSRPLPAVEADATQLRQIVMNLVINAAEAISDTNGTITITTGCGVPDKSELQNVWLDENLRSGEYLFLEISDNGCGMDEETLTKLFDPFFTTKFTGRGLGMAAVQGIVRGHQGAIKVSSKPGQGSTFKILLPASEKPAELRNDGSQADEWSGTGKVLLVDDEETVRKIGSEMLTELGFTVITANEGTKALEIYRSTPDIDLVILDLTMPHMDGEQCFRALRQIRPDVLVCLSSGYSEQEIARKFIGQGLAGFIQKPYGLQALRETLQRVTQDSSEHQ